MGISIDFISHLPMELQEDILKLMSMKEGKDYPIEINDNVYFVEEPVAKLVEELTEENIQFRNRIDEIDGIPKN
tara:strand:+ start:449 stop:670 length:222 start_codon:yes stop_codon:yes gene_type:complete